MLKVVQDERDAIVALAVEQQDAQRLTNAEVGALLGYSESAWSRVRRGERRPGTKMLRRMRRVFPDTEKPIDDYFSA